jgi:predicted TIM-barrel fold metal-dependent hydrolase
MTALWSGPVVDAHQHFWDPVANNHPWLAPDARKPFRYGDYSAIKRRYLPDDYRADAAGQDVVETVYVETEWDPADPIGETRYASGLAATFGLPNAIVAQAWLHHADAGEVLAAQAAFPLVRSVRHKPGGAETAREAAGATTLMTDLAWRQGFATLSRVGLHFDLQVAWWHLHEATRLAHDYPDTTIILNHTGLPSPRDPESLTGWRAAMAEFAICPNVVVKISGIGVPGHAWTVALNGDIVRSVLDQFGPSRCMFASNFPVDSLCARFDEIMLGMRQILAGYTHQEQAAFFCDNARRVYRTAPGTAAA